MVRLPADFLPFACEKTNTAVTPTDEMLRKHVDVLKRWKPQTDATVNDILLSAIRQETERHAASSVVVELSGIAQRPALNGTVANVVAVVDERVAVELESGERIKLLPSKLKVKVDGGQPQMLTLSEMKGELSKPVQPLGTDKSDPQLELCSDFFLKDPDGHKCYSRVIAPKNAGLTNLTDPDLLPALRKMVRLRLADSPEQQRQWETILRLSERKHFPEFRSMLQQLRSGVKGRRLPGLLAQNPDFQEMFDVCLSEGILKPRRVA